MFIKFGSLENIQDLYENGTVYLNTIQHFRDYEDQQLRGDAYEGASKVKNSLPGTFRIPGIDRDFLYEKIHLKEAYKKVIGNIYSLYCISSSGTPYNPQDFVVDSRVQEFGSHCLLVKNNFYFFEKIKEVLKANNYISHDGFVNYYDKEKYTGDVSLFDKPQEFAFQREFRFYVENSSIKPIVVQIGSLKQYAEIMETSEIIKRQEEFLSNGLKK